MEDETPQKVEVYLECIEDMLDGLSLGKALATFKDWVEKLQTEDEGELYRKSGYTDFIIRYKMLGPEHRDYDTNHYRLQLFGIRDETDKELLAREAEEKHMKDIQEDYQRKQYEQLKAKFEPKV